MNQPFISIIIPVYNVEKYIDRCLASIVSQSLRDIEIIMVNDASPDRSMEIVRGYQQHDNRIRIVDKDRNEGQMSARKSGCNIARGDYYVFCDSDDYLAEGALETLYKSAIETGADMVVGDYCYQNVRGGEIYYSRSKCCGSTPLEMQKALLNQDTVHTLWGIIFRRQLFDDYTYTTFIKQTLSEDRILLIQILCNARSLASTPVLTYYYCQNKLSSSRAKISDEGAARQLFAMDWCYVFLRDKQIFPELSDLYYLRAMSYFLETGYKPALVINYSDATRALFSFQKMRTIMGIRMACHTFLCANVSVYRRCIYSARLLIQRMQGKR